MIGSNLTLALSELILIKPSIIPTAITVSNDEREKKHRQQHKQKKRDIISKRLGELINTFDLRQPIDSNLTSNSWKILTIILVEYVLPSHVSKVEKFENDRQPPIILP